MDFDQQQTLILFFMAHNIFITALSLLLIKRRKVWGRRWWVDEVLKERPRLGAYRTVFLKYKRQQSERFFKLTRMSVSEFDELLNLVKRDLTKNSLRESLTPEFRLAFTVW